MHYGRIYRITNMVNSKIYIGATTMNPPTQRWNDHKAAYKKNDEHILYRAMRKYGIDNFAFEVIARCKNRRMLNIAEKALISLFGSHFSENGYNIQLGGDFSGKHCEATRKKMAKSWQENRYDDHIVPVDMYDTDGNFIKSYNSIKDAREDNNIPSRISWCCRGKARTVHGYVFRYKGEPFDKYSIDYENKPKAVLQIDPQTKDVINEFESMNAAAKHLGKPGGGANISAVCNGKEGYKTAYGYEWKLRNTEIGVT